MNHAKLRMGELTAQEAREIVSRHPVILLPLGSHEDQGPHAPMGDYLSAERIAELIAARATENGVETYVAPVLPFGGADYFGSVPGGIALSQGTLKAVLDDMFGCLLRHGLDRLVVINGHAGNVQPIHDATQAVYRARGILIPSFYLWRIAYGLLPGIHGAEKAAQAGGHGADPLASVTMHLFPQWMRLDFIPEPAPPPAVMGLPVSGFGTVRFEGVDVQIPVEVDEIAPRGVWHGDPRLSSAQTGAQLVHQLRELGARFVAHYAAARIAQPPA